MITHAQFKKTYIDKHVPIDVDNFPKGSIYQCFDLVKFYCRQVRWVELWHYGSAKNGWLNKETFPNCEFITPWPWHDMKQWDVFIWNVWDFGHIGIVDSAYNEWYTTFEQNAWKWWGDGKWDNAPRVWNRKYKPSLLWFVRHRPLPTK
jgi:hypothetical protein